MAVKLRAVSHEGGIERTLAFGEVVVDELDGARFEAGELIGRGGMGEVYRARRLSDGTPCALKCVRGDMVHEPTILLRTRFEAKAFRQISHPNVVRVHGSGIRADSVPWMAMEWLEGFTIGEILENRRRVPLRWAVEIVRDLCRGLRAIHEYGAIHRDIKPSNVHFGVDGVTRALDLGAAKSKEPNVHLTTTGSQVGTLPFMAPEQLDNTMGLDHRVDLWAATVVLYMLMTGVHPFAVGGDIPANKIKLGFSILTDPHRPLHEVLPSAPRFFGELIDRGLAKDPAERHRSAEELAQILTAALDYLTATTGHAEPLRSLAEQLAGEAKPVIAAPPHLLWGPRPGAVQGPRGTAVLPHADPTERLPADLIADIPGKADSMRRSDVRRREHRKDVSVAVGEDPAVHRSQTPARPGPLLAPSDTAIVRARLRYAVSRSARWAGPVGGTLAVMMMAIVAIYRSRPAAEAPPTPASVTSVAGASSANVGAASASASPPASASASAPTASASTTTSSSAVPPPRPAVRAIAPPTPSARPIWGYE